MHGHAIGRDRGDSSMFGRVMYRLQVMNDILYEDIFKLTSHWLDK